MQSETKRALKWSSCWPDLSEIRRQCSRCHCSYPPSPHAKPNTSTPEPRPEPPRQRHPAQRQRQRLAPTARRLTGAEGCSHAELVLAKARVSAGGYTVCVPRKSASRKSLGQATAGRFSASSQGANGIHDSENPMIALSNQMHMFRFETGKLALSQNGFNLVARANGPLVKQSTRSLLGRVLSSVVLAPLYLRKHMAGIFQHR